MFELEPSNAAAYLCSRQDLPVCCWRITTLPGGVSNTVLLAESDAHRLVLKQSLGRLRVEQDWFADRTRIHREWAALRALAPHFPPGSLPSVLFEDRPNCLFAMSAAPAGSRSWKSLLMDGRMDIAVAECVAHLEGVMLRASWNSPSWEQAFGDPTNMDQLRLDPYYRATAARLPDLAGFFQQLVASCLERRSALTHGDWSPKNFLVDGDRVTAIDFEVIHYGDPSFDAAFLINHLFLKSFRFPRHAAGLARLALGYWKALVSHLPSDAGWFPQATLHHLAGLLLARVDGKSPAEYLDTPDLRRQVREFAREAILRPPATLEALWERRNP